MKESAAYDALKPVKAFLPAGQCAYEGFAASANHRARQHSEGRVLQAYIPGRDRVCVCERKREKREQE